MLFLRRKKMALFLFDRGSRSKEHQKQQQQQQQEEEKKRRSKLRHSRVEDGLYGCVDDSSSSNNNKSSSKGRCMKKSDSSPNITSLSSDFVTTDGTSKADVDRRPGRGSEAGGSWLSEGPGSSQEGGYNGYGDGGGMFPCQAPRRSLSPIGSSDWALRECELHTTWLNELRKCGGEEPITDLRSAVADGVTLVQLTKTLTNCEVSVVEQDQRLSKSQAQVNLDRCLAQLAACGVDVIGIQAEALAEGDLKSALLLLGQIRRRFDSTAAVRRSPAPNRNRQAHAGQGGGGGAAGGSFTETVTVHPHPTPHRLLLEMPGRAEASPQLQRSSNRRPDLSPTMRRAYQRENDRILPGLMTSDSHSSHSRQHSADHLDRRPAQPQHHHQHHHNINNASVPSPYQSSHAPPSSSQPHFAPRPHSSIGVTSAERPPSQLGVAWSAESSSKVRQVSPPSPSLHSHRGGGNQSNVNELEKSVDKMKLDIEKKQEIHYV